jgi:hypothetical protein
MNDTIFLHCSPSTLTAIQPGLFPGKQCKACCSSIKPRPVPNIEKIEVRVLGKGVDGDADMVVGGSNDTHIDLSPLANRWYGNPASLFTGLMVKTVINVCLDSALQQGFAIF